MFQSRLAGTLQVLLMRVGGVRRLDALRALILRFPFGARLLRRPARLLAAGIATALALSVLAALVAFLL